MPQIQIRTTVTPADAAFIIGAFDSTLPHLESIGSGSQWGSIPFSQRGPEGGLIGIVDGMIEKAIEYRKTGNKDHVVVFIAEIGPLSQERTHDEPKKAVYRVGGDGRRFLQIGSAIIMEEFTDYLKECEVFKPEIGAAMERGDYVFLKVLVSDYRAGPLRKGAGATLVQAIRDYVKEVGKKTVYVDCYAGNDGGLVKFYEAQGFKTVGEFEFEKEGGVKWPSKFLQMAID